MWGATSPVLAIGTFLQINFYPRSPCGERHTHGEAQEAETHFYPRSPCGERPFSLASCLVLPYFYPRSPCGERLTGRKRNRRILLFLSTLPMRGATENGSILMSRRTNFYPRSPCGERLHQPFLLPSDVIFLSTLPMRGATNLIIHII